MSDENDAARVAEFPTAKCPMCAKPALRRYRPFCSKRCADLDLGAWLNESYRIPAEREGSGEDELPEQN